MKPKYFQHIPVTEQEAYDFLRYEWLKNSYLPVQALEHDIDLILKRHAARDGSGLGRLGAALILFCLLRDGYYPDSPHLAGERC